MAASRTRASHAYIEESGHVREVRPHDFSTAEVPHTDVPEKSKAATSDRKYVEWLESMLAAAHQRIAVLEETQETILSRLHDLESNKAGWKVLVRPAICSAVF